eukprot:SAG22_NODE_8647_length_639_cov_1.757407_1_plen_138_part_10
MPRLAELLDTSTDPSLQDEVVQTLEILSADDGALGAMLGAEPPVLPRLVELLGEPGTDADLTMSIMRVVNSLATEADTQAVLDAEAVPAIGCLLSRRATDGPVVTSSACVVLSNIAEVQRPAVLPVLPAALQLLGEIV